MLTDSNNMISWASDTHRSLDRTSLLALMRNELPFIRIRDFASHIECAGLLSRATAEGFSAYRDVEPQINRIGNTVFEYEKTSREEYFDSNKERQIVQKRIFGSFDPIARFKEMICAETGFDSEVARNRNGELYYAGLIRRIERGTLLHIDFAPIEQPSWEVAEVKFQLTWNLYLRTTMESGGLTHIFNRQWKPHDSRFRHGGYGYQPDVVEGAEEAVFRPSIGEAIIFNTHNYHYVEATQGDRVTVSSAVGLMPDGKLVLWS